MKEEKVFCNRVRDARKERSLSQEQLARMTNVSRQTICSIENGQFHPSAKLALTICEVLNQPFETLFFFEDSVAPKKEKNMPENMKNVPFETDEEAVKCFLVGVDSGEYDAEYSMGELALLCETAGLDVKGQTIQKKDHPDGATCVGIGKLEEIRQFASANGITLLVFDLELTAVQMRNIENETGCAVLDRTMIILDIFASRARSAEGKLQVELAQQQYRLPRLSGIGTDLSRLGGGIGTRGPGETKLETDRRAIRQRISFLKGKLAEMSEKREVTRRKREKNQIPVVALAGYTNAGKSTLLNKLTDANVMSANMLFATLDPTARSLELPGGQSAILVDTVGFISRLPHHLVDAFRSTLEEVISGDVVLLVADSSDPAAAQQMEVSRNLLAELGCDAGRILTVMNQIDKLPKEDRPVLTEQMIPVSARTGEGLDTLLERIAEKLKAGFIRITVLLPYDKAGLLSKVREKGAVYSEDYQEEGLLADILVEERYQSLLLSYRQ